MYKTVLVLPDGTQISSGTASKNAIISAKFTDCVNAGTELTLGSVCANMLEVTVFTPDESIAIRPGTELMVYREDEQGNRIKKGLYTAEKPVRPSANTYKLTAYDRVSWLDRDLTQWLAGLDGWPYRLLTFARMVCSACGLILVNTDIPNGDYAVQRFSGSGITGRKLLSWVGEASARFCRATPDGDLELAWYIPANVSLTPGGSNYYFQNGLQYENYGTALIKKVHIRMQDDDNGVMYPDTAADINTYMITGNFLLTATETQTLRAVAQEIFQQLQDFSYIPCTVRMPDRESISAGNTVEITDRNGKIIKTCVFTKQSSGHSCVLESTGSFNRASSTATNNESYQALNRKMLVIQKGLEGLTIKASELSNQVDTVSMETSTKVSAEAVEIEVRRQIGEGVDKVTTATGYTFDEEGLRISKSGEAVENLLDNTGMTVSSGGQEVLFAGSRETTYGTTETGVFTKDLQVTTYLAVGERSRFENYGDSRTGCFWIGG